MSETTPKKFTRYEEQKKKKRKQYKQKLKERQKSEKQQNLTSLERKVQVEDNLNDLIKIANGMFQQLKDIINDSGEKFTKMSDKHKLQFFREDLGYAEFMKEFPVTARYLVCMGQYSPKAFRRFLDRVRYAKHPSPMERPKGYMEDQWVRRQADYVRYLWEAYQKGHRNNSEAKRVWQEAYGRLKGEFDDFRDKYKEVEKFTKEERKKHDAERAKELLRRYADGVQTPETDEEKQKLLHMLTDQVYRHRFNRALAELLERVPQTKAVTNARGKYDGPENKPTVRMIEHIDPRRMNEVPEHMKLTEEDMQRLPTSTGLQ